jgi:DNA-binding MarR family transcriptional regulator
VLSKAGQNLYNAIAPKALEFESRLLAGFSPVELASLTAMLHRIDAAALDLGPPGATAE